MICLVVPLVCRIYTGLYNSTDFSSAADMKTGGGVYKGEPKQGKADCTLTIDDQAMMDMSAGKLDGQTVSRITMGAYGDYF